MNPDQLRQSVHDLYTDKPGTLTLHAARQLGVAEADVVRHLPGGRAVELDIARFDQLMAALEPVGDVHVIVTNAATTLEAVGRFGGFSRAGGYFNVQTDSLDMHIRDTNIGAAFGVRKPSHMDGGDTCSIQFFDGDGSSAFKVFLSFGGKSRPERVTAWEAIVNEFRLRA